MIHRKRRFNRHSRQGRTQGRVLGLTPPLYLICCKNVITCTKEIDCFCIIFYRYLDDLMQIPRYEFECKFQGTLSIGQNVIIGFWWESRLLSGYWNRLSLLQTFRPLRMFKIVFRNSSFYPKQLSLFCVLWLTSECADCTTYTTLPISVAR